MTQTRKPRWDKKQLYALGKAMDRLLIDSSTRLLPKHELLTVYAQREALPLEQRKPGMSKAHALAVLAKIDQLRDEQEQAEWAGTAETLLEEDVTTLVTDSEEVKRLSALLLQINKVEQSLTHRLESINKAMDSQFARLESLIKSVGDSVEVTTEARLASQRKKEDAFDDEEPDDDAVDWRRPKTNRKTKHNGKTLVVLNSDTPYANQLKQALTFHLSKKLKRFKDKVDICSISRLSTHSGFEAPAPQQASYYRDVVVIDSEFDKECADFFKSVSRQLYNVVPVTRISASTRFKAAESLCLFIERTAGLSD